MKKTLAALALTLVAGTAAAAELVEAVIVRVGDRIVTSSQYERRLRDAMLEIEETVAPEQRAARREQVRKGLVDEIVNELLIKDRADRLGITVSDAEIADAIGRLKQQYGITSDAQFDESLRKSGLTRADMEARLRDTLLTNKIFGRELRSREDMSDRELKERYDREKDQYRLPERARLREIVILKPESPIMAQTARSRAESLAVSARAEGADFAAIATTSSESATKDRGGDLGEIAMGELIADLDRAVFNSAPGSVVGPIETRSAWHIVKVEQRLPSEVPGFESVKDKLRKDASEETFQRDYKAYIDRLRKEAFVQVNEQYVPKA